MCRKQAAGRHRESTTLPFGDKSLPVLALQTGTVRLQCLGHCGGDAVKGVFGTADQADRLAEAKQILARGIFARLRAGKQLERRGAIHAFHAPGDP